MHPEINFGDDVGLEIIDLWPMRIWLDNERPVPEEFNSHAKTAGEAISLLASSLVEKISLDHGLGEAEDAGTGYDVALYIEQVAY